MGKNQFVVPAGDNWGVRGQGNSRLTVVTQTKAEAVARAREISQNSSLNCSYLDETDESRAGTRTEMIHFHQEVKKDYPLQQW